jgi:hypothetical protein
MNRHIKWKKFQHVMPSLLIAIFSVSLSSKGLDQHGFHWWSSVSAAEAGHGSGHSSSGHGSSYDSGHDDSGEEEEGGHGGKASGHKGYGAGRGGSSHESPGGGGKAVESNIFKGQRPVWAQEGIPEVELGRLNVSRAPSRVLARAEDEALATYLSEMSALYNLSADDAAKLLETNFRDVSRYDSPLQNLALYKDVMIFGKTELNNIDPNLTPSSQLDLAAIFLGSASDKTMPISENTVIALNRILGLVELSPEERNILATKAETVRQSILIGHGPTDEH